MDIVFLVQGSSPEPYKLLFRRGAANLTARCNCQAGISGMACKHRIRILHGDPEGVVSPNVDQVPLVASWLSGSDVEIVLNELQAAVARLEQAKLEVSAFKKALARSLAD